MALRSFSSFAWRSSHARSSSFFLLKKAQTPYISIAIITTLQVEEEHAREAALYAQKKKEDALRNAEMMGVIFGAEMEAYLLARDFAEEIKEDPWLYCALTDVDPWLVNIL